MVPTLVPFQAHAPRRRILEQNTLTGVTGAGRTTQGEAVIYANLTEQRHCGNFAIGICKRDTVRVSRMGKELSPAKVLLLAALLAAQSDIGKLAFLTIQNAHVLRPEIILRVLLTYLPETAEPRTYTEFLRDLSAGQLRAQAEVELDTCSVDTLSDEAAIKKATKLRLISLRKQSYDLGNGTVDGLLHEFLFQRTYRINTEVGALSQLPELLQPFLDYCPPIKCWAASTVFPFVRRNCQNHINTSPRYTLSEFENLPDRTAAIYLLSQSTEGDGEATGRDLRELVAPWLHNDMRWKQETASEGSMELTCPGWEQVQDTMLSWATKSWASAVGALKHWNGPRDVYFGENIIMSLSEDRTQYLEKTYATTAVACVYSIPESSEEALRSSYQVCRATRKRLDKTESSTTLEEILSDFSLLPVFKTTLSGDAKMATCMRHDLLTTSNPLTSATPESLDLITALTISAYISTSFGVPWSVRKAGDLLFIGDEREQRSELSKLLRGLASQAPRDDDSYWQRSRDAIIWLSNWGYYAEITELSRHSCGPLGMVSREHIETEILKTLLSKSSMTLEQSDR